MQKIDLEKYQKSNELSNKAIKSNLWAWGVNHKHELAVFGTKIYQDEKVVGRVVWTPEPVPLPNEIHDDDITNIRVR